MDHAEPGGRAGGAPVFRLVEPEGGAEVLHAARNPASRRLANRAPSYSSVKLMLTFTRIEIWPGAIVASLESVDPPKLCETFCAAMP